MNVHQMDNGQEQLTHTGTQERGEAMYVPHARKNKSYCFWNRVYPCGPAVTLVKRHDKKFNDVIALSKQRWRHTRAQPLAYRASKCTQHDAFVPVICARVSRTFWPVVYGKLHPTLCSNIEMFPGKMSFSRPVDIYVDSVLQCIHREKNMATLLSRFTKSFRMRV